LQRQGWKVMRFWEHDLRDHPERCLKIVQRNLNSYPRLPSK
jgi:very-short-patch-repair endonuclease